MNRPALLFLTLALAGCGGDSEPAPAPPTTETAATTGTATDGPRSVRCSNAEGAFSVAYPEDWHEERCTYFDPEPIELEPATEAPPVAVTIRREPVPLEVAAGESPAQEILSREEVTVAGRDAVRLEVESTGQGLLPAGVRTRLVLVPVDGDTIVASTREHEVALAQMLESLELLSAEP